MEMICKMSTNETGFQIMQILNTLLKSASASKIKRTAMLTVQGKGRYLWKFAGLIIIYGLIAQQLLKG